uniref:Bm11891 n=1 Tax=Brugia malayi TaxID=6279 RepID=A0A1I9G9V6_BRUMA|nr:Bm11891 [Brugia malayi]
MCLILAHSFGGVSRGNCPHGFWLLDKAAFHFRSSSQGYTEKTCLKNPKEEEEKEEEEKEQEEEEEEKRGEEEVLQGGTKLIISKL